MNDVELIIDRIIFDGFDIPQSREESIKLLLQTRIRQKIAETQRLNGSISTELTHITSQEAQIIKSYSDSHIAASISKSIIGAMDSMHDNQGP